VAVQLAFACIYLSVVILTGSPDTMLFHMLAEMIAGEYYSMRRCALAFLV
jgi:hypothetical protein